MKIPLVDLKANYASIKAEIDDAIRQILENTSFIMGPPVQQFEEAWSAFCQVPASCGVANGTEAVRLSLLAVGVGPGDEVITVPNTFIATTEAITACGAKVVFVDVDERTYTIDVNRIEEKITDRTKAILAVHLYGHPCDLDALKALADSHGLALVGDCAQSHGALYKGRMTSHCEDISSFSMFPAKVLGAFGDAGMVSAGSADLIDRVKLLRNHGRVTKHEHLQEGFNARLDALQAAILNAKLKHLPGWIARRRAIAAHYNEALPEGITCPFEADWADHVYYMYVIQVPDRDRFMGAMKEKGVSCGIHYPIPLHRQPAYQYLGHGEGDFPVTEAITKKIVSIPLYPELTDNQIDYIVDCIKQIQKQGKTAQS